MRTFGIVGLGLMGGAIAMALREKCGIPQEQLSACDMHSEVLREAQEQELISKSFAPECAGEMLSACDVVFLCLNPSGVICFLEKWSASFKAGSIITDIAGTKTSIACTVRKLCAEGASFDFIPGHPMAGAHTPSGKSGFINSHLVDFTGKNYILTPLDNNKPENIEYLKNLIYKMGFNRITEVTPEEHDYKIAFTSQLCHVIASALVDCEGDTEITRFGGGSFEDLTRIAMLNAPMWTEIFMENKKVLLDRIDQFENSLDEIKKLIADGNETELKSKLETVRNRRIEMNRSGNS